VTVLRAAQLRRLGIEAVKNLSDIVPNLYAPSYGSRMTSSIYMRGLGSRIDQAVVGLSVDGVPFLTKDAYDFDIPDIAVIDVLRGARSVLNGRNAMAGQINIYTLSPRDFQGVRAMVEYGRFNSLRASAGVYGRINPRLFSSLTAAYNTTDGYWRNAYNGKRTGEEHSASLRWKTVWHPSAGLSLTNTASGSFTRQSGYPYASAQTRQIAYNDTCFYRRNTFADGLTLAWAGKRVVVTSLTSVAYLDDNMTLDQDFTPADFFTLSQLRREWTVTEDLFAKGSRGAYSWLGGVFGYLAARPDARPCGIQGGRRDVAHRRQTQRDEPVVSHQLGQPYTASREPLHHPVGRIRAIPSEPLSPGRLGDRRRPALGPGASGLQLCQLGRRIIHHLAYTARRHA